MGNIVGVDIFIAVVLIVSALLSFFRGFISEMMGLGAWFLASIVGFYIMPFSAPFVLNYLPKPLLANIVSLVVVAIVTLILLTLACSKVEKKVRKSALNRLDHFLGFIFGAVRGIVILVLIYFLMMTLAPKYLERLQKESKAFPYLERVTESVKEQLPESLFDNPTQKEEQKEPDEIEELIEKLNSSSKKTKPAKKIEKTEPEKPLDPEKADDLFNALNNPQVEDKPSDLQVEGYNEQEREELDKLFLESVEEAQSVVD